MKKSILNIVLTTCISLITLSSFGQAAFVTSNSGFYGYYGSYPWGSLDYINCMNNVFGPNWDNLQFENVDPNVLFSNAYSTIYLEGSDFAASALASFIAANQTLMEDWVLAGGLLYVNSAPNVGGNINIGFGGVEILYDPYYYYYGTFTDCVEIAPNIAGNCLITDSPVDVTSAFPICGNFFGHSFISGPNLIPILVNDVSGDVVLAEFPFGAGNVVVGGITSPMFHDPVIEAKQLLENTITNVGCSFDFCVDAIEGEIIAPFDCDLSGINVVISIINDDGSETIVGTAITDADGNYTLLNPGNGDVWNCGNYSAMLMLPLPDCYADDAGNQGPTGPITFTVDGDGNADGAIFELNAEVPTLSEWGIIVLALLLMNFGAIVLIGDNKLLKQKFA